MLRIFCPLLLCFALLSAKAEGVKDTLGAKDVSLKVRPRQFILPGTLILAGSLGVGHGCLKPLSRKVKSGMDNLRGASYIRVDDYLQYLPVASHLALGALGARTKHGFKERALVAATSYLAMGMLVKGMKWVINEQRPDSYAENSFPSGHTATVFMGAELVRSEYGLGYGVGAYTIATGVAFLRLYNGRHWLSDVLAGAGVGILSARIGYWMLPVWRNWLGLNKHTSTQTAFLPTYDYQTKAVGLVFSMRF